MTLDKAIQKANEKITFVSSDKEALHAYQMREMAMSDYTSGMNFARREGLLIGEQKGMRIGEQKGLRIGKQEGMREAAKKLKEMGLPLEQIVEATGLSMPEIVKL